MTAIETANIMKQLDLSQKPLFFGVDEPGDNAEELTM